MRVFSFAQESTRYCNYSKDKFNNELTFITPCWLNIPEGKLTLRDKVTGGVIPVRTYIANDNPPMTEYEELPDIKLGVYYSNETPIIDDWEDDTYLFIRALELSEDYYKSLIAKGWKPQEVRAILPNALKTELVMTGFVSDWSHFFRLRSRIAETGKPHPQAQELADPLMDEFYNRNLIK